VSCSKSDKVKFLDLAEANDWSVHALKFYIEHGHLPETTGTAGQFEIKIISMYDKYFDTLNGKPLTQSEFESIKRSAKALVKSIDDGLEQLERNIVKR